jgi:putative addiction module killer protein
MQVTAVGKRILSWSNEKIAKIAEMLTGAVPSVSGESEVHQAVKAISRGEQMSEQLLGRMVDDLREVARRQGISCLVLSKFPDIDRLALENRYACMPLLQLATEPGDEGALQARQEYEKRRLSHVEFLPAYASELCSKVCQEEFSKVKVTASRDQANRDEVVRHAPALMAQIQEHGLLECSLFSGAFSHASAFAVLEKLRPAQYRKVFSGHFEGREFVMLDRFSPASDGPLGEAAAVAWKRMASIALATVVLEDLLSVCSFPVSDVVKQKAISTLLSRQAAEPWQISDSRLVHNVWYLQELSLAGEITPEVLSVLAASKSALLGNSIQTEVDDLQFTQAKKRQAQASALPVPAKPIPNPSTDREYSNMHGNPKWEFYMAIHSACPDLPFDRTFREHHAALYRVYRKTAITLRECIDLVRQGVEAENRFVSEQTISGALLPPRDAFEVSGLEPSPEAEDALDSQLDGVYTISGLGEPWFEKWKEGLDKSYRELVEGRLERVENANFGDWRRLQGIPGLCELRFHRGQGERIYFRFTGPNSIELVDAGPKGEQSQILSRLRK